MSEIENDRIGVQCRKGVTAPRLGSAEFRLYCRHSTSARLIVALLGLLYFGGGALPDFLSLPKKSAARGVIPVSRLAINDRGLLDFGELGRAAKLFELPPT